MRETYSEEKGNVVIAVIVGFDKHSCSVLAPLPISAWHFERSSPIRV